METDVAPVQRDNGAAGDAAARRMAQNDSPIVYVGLNEGAGGEAAALGRENARRGGVTAITPHEKDPDSLTRGGTTYDLETEAGTAGYANTLGLPADQAARVRALFSQRDTGTLAQIADIVELWLAAERGERTIERLVLSGHCVSDSIFGSASGFIHFDLFQQLSSICPKAAGQVKHLMLSACYSGCATHMDYFVAIFPNIETIWAYAGQSPGGASGAIAHERAWEHATSGSDVHSIDLNVARGTRWGDHVAVWSRGTEPHYQGPPMLEFSELKKIIEVDQPMFDRYYTDGDEVENADSGPLREYYSHLQDLAGRPELTGDDQTHYVERRDVTIRLLKYNSVRGQFAAAHAAEIQKGYAAVGMVAPDFARLSRKDALAAISAFEARVGADAPADAAAARTLLVDGLVHLSPSVIRENWV